LLLGHDHLGLAWQLLLDTGASQKVNPTPYEGFRTNPPE
jgi:hypothetical protein